MKLKFSEEIDLFMLITNQFSVEPQPSTSWDISNPSFSKLWFCAGKMFWMISWKSYGLKHPIFDAKCRIKRGFFRHLNFFQKELYFVWYLALKVALILVLCRNFLVLCRKTLTVYIFGHRAVETLIFFYSLQNFKLFLLMSYLKQGNLIERFYSHLKIEKFILRVGS